MTNNDDSDEKPSKPRVNFLNSHVTMFKKNFLCQILLKL